MSYLYQPGDRRDRLRYLLSKIQGHDVESEEESGSEIEEEVMWATFFNKRALINEIEQDDEEFFTPGSTELLEARKWITKYSLPRYVYTLIFDLHCC